MFEVRKKETNVIIQEVIFEVRRKETNVIIEEVIFEVRRRRGNCYYRRSDVRSKKKKKK